MSIFQRIISLIGRTAYFSQGYQRLADHRSDFFCAFLARQRQASITVSRESEPAATYGNEPFQSRETASIVVAESKGYLLNFYNIYAVHLPTNMRCTFDESISEEIDKDILF